MTDDDIRTWFVFALPGATAFVPADSEDAARRVLRATCFRDAPIHAWPVIGQRWCSRDVLALTFERTS